MVYQENTEAKAIDSNEEVIEKSLEMLRQAQERMDHQVERFSKRLQMILRPSEEVRATTGITANIPTRQPSPLVESLQVATRRLNESANALSDLLERCDL